VAASNERSGISAASAAASTWAPGFGPLALLAGGTGARAIQHSGEQRVRGAIREALVQFCTDTGEYRIQNRFRFVIAGGR
jgi:hypothetical protein